MKRQGINRKFTETLEIANYSPQTINNYTSHISFF